MNQPLWYVPVVPKSDESIIVTALRTKLGVFRQPIGVAPLLHRGLRITQIDDVRDLFGDVNADEVARVERLLGFK